MPTDRTTLSPAEVDAMLTATATSRVIKKKDNVAFLGNVKTPTLNMMRSRSRSRSGPPTRGAYKCHFSPPRGKKLQATSGRDIHNFETVDTLFDVEYAVGRVHLGDEWVHQQISEAGIEINHAATANTQMIDTSARGWWKKGKDAYGILVNLADQKLTSFELNYTQELNKDMWRAHASNPKFWNGIDSLLSVASNTTGPVGNRDRSNKYLRHQLVSVDNRQDWEIKLDKMRRDQERRIHDGSGPNYSCCGQNVYDAIKDQMFSGSSAVTGVRFDRNMDVARSEARAMGEKFGIGMPDDAIYLSGVGIITVEPVFEDLDAEDAPAIPWEDRFYCMNLEHISFKPTSGRDGAKKVHQTPYNQEVTRISCYGEYALCADWLDCHGVAYANY